MTFSFSLSLFSFMFSRDWRVSTWNLSVSRSRCVAHPPRRSTAMDMTMSRFMARYPCVMTKWARLFLAQASSLPAGSTGLSSP